MFMIAHDTEKFKLVFKEGLQEKTFSLKLNTSLDTLYGILKKHMRNNTPSLQFLDLLGTVCSMLFQISEWLQGFV